MSATACFIGVDLGTSACKALAIDTAGAVIATASAEYELSTPRPGWAEQAPSDWQNGCDRALRALVAALPSGAVPQAIGLSGQMHGLVALDHDDRVIRPAILWCDNRTGRQCDAMTDEAGGLAALLGLTNNRMLPGFTGGKLRWLRENEPDTLDQMRRFLLPKDFLRLHMTGEHATDVSDASGTGLFDVQNRCWSESMLALAGVSVDQVPVALESHEVSGRLRPEMARHWGLPVELPVVAGGGDSVIQTTSMGVIDPGVIGITIGTAGLVGASNTSCPENPQGLLQVSCGNAPGRWHVMGVTLNGGGAFQWWRDALAAGGERPGINFEALCALAASVPAGAEGLLFLPFLMGERCPEIAPDGRGAWVGLTRRHDLRHMTRAAMEGILFNLKTILGLVRTSGVQWNTLRVSGGAAASPLWLQMLADVANQEVSTVTGAAEGGAYGAALLAGVGSGEWKSLEEAVGVIRTTQTVQPASDTAEIYGRLHPIHAGLFEALGDSMERLSAAESACSPARTGGRAA
ncbi:MAG: xylulokinase [Janthinobacterium lividum]